MAELIALPTDFEVFGAGAYGSVMRRGIYGEGVREDDLMCFRGTGGEVWSLHEGPTGWYRQRGLI